MTIKASCNRSNTSWNQRTTESRLFASAAALLESGCLPQIDCLISDVDMPGVDGFELLRLVQASRPELPIILITGYPDRLTRLPLSEEAILACSRSLSGT